MTATLRQGAREPFVHEALFYRDPQDYLAGTLPFIHAGLAADEPVLVAVPGANSELLWAGLGSAATHVRFLDMSVAGRNPGRIIPTVLLAFADEHEGERVRIIGEPIWAGRSAIEYPVCVQHEALINVALAGRPARILCPYDAGRLDAAVLTDAESTHPVLGYGGLREPSPRYTDPGVVVARFNRAMAEPAVSPVSLVFEAGRLSELRGVVKQQAVTAGLPADRVYDLQLAVTEVAGNSLKHGSGPGTLRVWRDNGTVVCEVRDSGRLVDALAGRRPPSTGGDGGRGLFLVHCLCDLVEIHTAEDSTTIRLHMAVPS